MMKVLDEEQLSVYPNPANSRIIVLVPSSAEYEFISVADVSGNTVLEQERRELNEIDITSLMNGEYLVIAKSNNEKTLVVKLIKE